VIDQINGISGTIATAVEEQSATTNEMTRNVGEAAKGAGEISSNITAVTQAADGMSSRALQSQMSSQELAEINAKLSSLMAQFKIERRDARVDRALPVQLTGTDINGNPLDQTAITINVSRNGSLLGGIRASLRVGDRVYLTRQHKKEQFLVEWVAESNTPQAGRIGVSAMASSTAFWDDVLEPAAASQPKKARAMASGK